MVEGVECSSCGHAQAPPPPPANHAEELTCIVLRLGMEQATSLQQLMHTLLCLLVHCTWRHCIPLRQGLPSSAPAGRRSAAPSCLSTPRRISCPLQQPTSNCRAAPFSHELHGQACNLRRASWCMTLQMNAAVTSISASWASRWLNMEPAPGYSGCACQKCRRDKHCSKLGVIMCKRGACPCMFWF